METQIQETKITNEMRDCYIDYAMSVIIGRALPDVRDGMKPVHRRILYAMNELGLMPERPFRKCVRIVGDVLGKFHPHGDVAVYEALTRMAQDFTTRYPTVMGHGNFGSIDGDAPAAMRYTEAKMDFISKEMLRDINKNTVDFIDNFDGSEMEPEVLTARFPHLLVNGSSGIAVGMATNMPPHNLGEVIDATIAYLKNPNITTDQLLKKLPGPDFPTGGLILGRDGIKDAYETGTGKVVMRGRAHTQKGKRGKSEIIITELPYQVNKAKLIEKIASLHNHKKIEGLTEIRDESDLKQGIKIVIDVKKGVDPNILLNQLYKYTELEKPFGVINLALVPDDNNNLHPRILSLKSILQEYVTHQRNVITRRTEFDLQKAQNRAHIVEGLLTALDNIDEIISIIRHSQKTKTAQAKLMKRFKLSEVQAQAILDMRLQRLVGLERKRLKDEYLELKKQITYFKKILSSQDEVDKVIIDELKEIKKNYNDERRTEIVDEMIELEPEQIILEKELQVSITSKGFINSQASGRNRKITCEDDEIITYEFKMSNLDSLLFITNKGKSYQLKGVNIPDVRGRGKNIKSLFSMSDSEQIINALPVKDFNNEEELILVTSRGLVKKIELKELDSMVKNGLSIISLKGKDDQLIAAFKYSSEQSLVLGSNTGFGIRFECGKLRPMGRSAAGVKGISLTKEEKCIGASFGEDYLITISDKGFAKKFEVSDLNIQNRAGKGLKIASTGQNLFDLFGSSKIITEFYLKTPNALLPEKISKISQRTDKGICLTKDDIEEVLYPKT